MWAMIAAAVIEGIKTVGQMYQNNQEKKEVQRQAQADADERMRKAQKQMQEQKTSFLKGGVGFDSASANSVINETYTFAKKDVKDINRDSKMKQRNYRLGNMLAIVTGTSDAAKAASEAYKNSKTNNENKNYTVGTKASNTAMKNKASGWSDSSSFGKNADKVV